MFDLSDETVPSGVQDRGGLTPAGENTQATLVWGLLAPPVLLLSLACLWLPVRVATRWQSVMGGSPQISTKR